MKVTSQLVTSALLLGWLQMAHAADATPLKHIKLDDLQSGNGAIVDTRPSAFYNGWPQGLNGPSGH